MNFYDYEDVIRLLTVYYSKENLMETLKKYLRANKKIKLGGCVDIDGVKIPSFIEKDAIEFAVKIYDDEIILEKNGHLSERKEVILL